MCTVTVNEEKEEENIHILQQHVQNFPPLSIFSQLTFYFGSPSVRIFSQVIAVFFNSPFFNVISSKFTLSFSVSQARVLFHLL